MWMPRSLLGPKRFLSKFISNSVCTRKKSMLLCNVNALNSLFYAEKVEKAFSYHFSSLSTVGIEVKPLLAISKRGNISNRFYSGDPTVTFLSRGKPKNFLDKTIYDADMLLNKVIRQLKEDNGVNICVIETSEERRKYADFVVVVSGRSTRHLKAMTNHIHQQAKKDFPEKNLIVTGLNSDDWMILDFGAIVIHLFLPEIREKYELEKLWSLGPEHDEQYQQMLEDDRYAKMVRNAKLEDFFVHEDTNK